MLLLGVALIVGQILERNRVEWMSEAGASLIIGILLGLGVTLAGNLDYQFSELFKFNVCFQSEMLLTGADALMFGVFCMLFSVSLNCSLMQTNFFFIFLLPPIIFDAGFNLDVGPYVCFNLDQDGDSFVLLRHIIDTLVPLQIFEQPGRHMHASICGHCSLNNCDSGLHVVSRAYRAIVQDIFLPCFIVWGHHIGD